jgi:hypothetical protein
VISDRDVADKSVFSCVKNVASYLVYLSQGFFVLVKDISDSEKMKRSILVFVISCLTFYGVAYASNTYQIDSHNRFILNGEPFFPLGLYVVQCTNGSYTTELDEIADSPFDTLMNYAINECGTEASYQQIRDYLDELARRDLKVIFSLKEYIST